MKIAILKIKLVPDLEHCIETVARAEHRKLQDYLLTGAKGQREAEEKLELLGLFLETADFKKLRAESEKQLVEGKKVKFTIYMENGKPAYKMSIT